MKKIFLSDKKEELLYLTGEISNLINSLNVIYLGGEKASTVVKALKNYSHRSENEKISEVILQNELEQAFTLFYNKMKANVELIRNYKTEGKIRGYKDQLSQVWINLISNSLYAMNNSGQLVAEIYENQEEVRVLLTDSGKGIPEDIQHRIFDPFFSTKKSGEGIGLGLDIVKKIIDTHEANIEVSSTPGKTTFTIIFNKNFEG